MKVKKMLFCLSVLGLVSVFSTGGVYAQSGELSIEKPELIQESGLSGILDSSLNSGEDKMNLIVPFNEEMNSNEDISQGSSSNGQNGEYDFMTPNDILGNEKVTIESFGGKIIDRLLDVVSFFQTFAKPFTIIMFILSALLSLISLVFGTKNFKTGLLGVMFSILAYVGVMYAPDIVMFFAQWLSV